MSQRETIALVSCVKSKVPGPCAAKDLYTSVLFRYMRTYAEDHADRWFILSAKHGLMDPEATVVAYEQTLNNISARLRRQWAQRVYQQMDEAKLLRGDARFLWLAGKAYRHDLALMLRDFEQDDPLAGLGIGKRLAWLKAAVRPT
jgi:hypothetical protein